MSRSSSCGGSGSTIIRTTPMMPNGTTTSHLRSFEARDGAGGHASRATHVACRVRDRHEAGRRTPGPGPRRRSAPSVSASDGHLGVQRARERPVLQDGDAVLAGLGPDPQGIIVVALGDHDRRRIGLLVAEGHRHVRGVRDDDLRLLDVLQRALLRQRPGARLQSPLDPGIAILLTHLLHDFLTRHLELTLEREAALDVVQDGNGEEHCARAEDDVQDRVDHPPAGHLDRNTGQ